MRGDPVTRDLYIAGPAGKDAPRAWKLTRNSEVMSYHDTQQAAIDTGVLLCRNRMKMLGKLAELQIKGQDGQIKDARTYGDDPQETKG